MPVVAADRILSGFSLNWVSLRDSESGDLLWESGAESGDDISAPDREHEGMHFCSKR